MPVDDNKAMIRRLFDEVWTGDVAAADRYYAAGPQLDGLKEFATALYTALPDWRVTIDDLIGEGDTIAVRWTGTGTHLGPWDGSPPTGQRVTTTGIDFEHIVDGKIVREDGVVDMLGFSQQIAPAERLAQAEG
jgi:predicted ester cyclase